MPTLTVSHTKHLFKEKKIRINAFHLIKNTVHTENFIVETQLGEVAYIRLRNLPIVFKLSLNNGLNSKNLTDDSIIDFLSKKVTTDIIAETLKLINEEMLFDATKKRSNNFLSLLKTGDFRDSYNVEEKYEIPKESPLLNSVYQQKDNTFGYELSEIKPYLFSVIRKEESHAVLEKEVLLKIIDGFFISLKIFYEDDLINNSISKDLNSGEFTKMFLEFLCKDQKTLKHLLKSKLKLKASNLFAKNLSKFISI